MRTEFLDILIRKRKKRQHMRQRNQYPNNHGVNGVLEQVFGLTEKIQTVIIFSGSRNRNLKVICFVLKQLVDPTGKLGVLNHRVRLLKLFTFICRQISNVGQEIPSSTLTDTGEPFGFTSN